MPLNQADEGPKIPFIFGECLSDSPVPISDRLSRRRWIEKTQKKRWAVLFEPLLVDYSGSF